MLVSVSKKKEILWKEKQFSQISGVQCKKKFRCHDGSPRASSGCCCFYSCYFRIVTVYRWVCLLNNNKIKREIASGHVYIAIKFLHFHRNTSHRGIPVGTRSLSRWLTIAQCRGIREKCLSRYRTLEFDVIRTIEFV